jgi:toxin CptA
MQLPLTVSLRPSRRLGVLLVFAHLCAVAAAWLITIPWSIKLALFAAILASAGYQLFRLTGQGRIRRLILKDDGHLEFSRVDGSGGEARIHPQTTVTSLLAVLLLRQEGRIEALVLLPDALNAEDFRLLRLWLRWCVARDQ